MEYGDLVVDEVPTPKVDILELHRQLEKLNSDLISERDKTRNLTNDIGKYVKGQEDNESLIQGAKEQRKIIANKDVEITSLRLTVSKLRTAARRQTGGLLDMLEGVFSPTIDHGIAVKYWRAPTYSADVPGSVRQQDPDPNIVAILHRLTDKEYDLFKEKFDARRKSEVNFRYVNAGDRRVGLLHSRQTTIDKRPWTFAQVRDIGRWQPENSVREVVTYQQQEGLGKRRRQDHDLESVGFVSSPFSNAETAEDPTIAESQARVEDTSITEASTRLKKAKARKAGRAGADIRNRLKPSSLIRSANGGLQKNPKAPLQKANTRLNERSVIDGTISERQERVRDEQIVEDS